MGDFHHESAETQSEMSTCGALVSSEWSRLAIFKEVTTTVWRSMAHVFVFGKNKTKYIKIH